MLYLAGKIVISSLPTTIGDAVIRYFDSKSLHALVRRRSQRRSERRSFHHGRHRCNRRDPRGVIQLT